MKELAQPKYRIGERLYVNTHRGRMQMGVRYIYRDKGTFLYKFVNNKTKREYLAYEDEL